MVTPDAEEKPQSNANVGENPKNDIPPPTSPKSDTKSRKSDKSSQFRGKLKGVWPPPKNQQDDSNKDSKAGSAQGKKSFGPSTAEQEKSSNSNTKLTVQQQGPGKNSISQNRNPSMYAGSINSSNSANLNTGPVYRSRYDYARDLKVFETLIPLRVAEIRERGNVTVDTSIDNDGIDSTRSDPIVENESQTQDKDNSDDSDSNSESKSDTVVNSKSESADNEISSQDKKKSKKSQKKKSTTDGHNNNSDSPSASRREGSRPLTKELKNGEKDNDNDNHSGPSGSPSLTEKSISPPREPGAGPSGAWGYYRLGAEADDSSHNLDPLIFLPPESANAEVYFYLLDSLSAKGYKCVALSHPPIYTLEEFAAGFAKFLDHIRARRCHLFGAGLGGYLAQCYAAVNPRRVASMILCNSYSSATSAPHGGSGPTGGGGGGFSSLAANSASSWNWSTMGTSLISMLPAKALQRIVLKTHTFENEPDTESSLDFLMTKKREAPTVLQRNLLTIRESEAWVKSRLCGDMSCSGGLGNANINEAIARAKREKKSIITTGQLGGGIKVTMKKSTKSETVDTVEGKSESEAKIETSDSNELQENDPFQSSQQQQDKSETPQFSALANIAELSANEPLPTKRQLQKVSLSQNSSLLASKCALYYAAAQLPPKTIPDSKVMIMQSHDFGNTTEMIQDLLNKDNKSGDKSSNSLEANNGNAENSQSSDSSKKKKGPLSIQEQAAQQGIEVVDDDAQTGTGPGSSSKKTPVRGRAVHHVVVRRTGGESLSPDTASRLQFDPSKSNAGSGLQALRRRYSDSKVCHLKFGGCYPYLCNVAETSLMIEVHLRNNDYFPDYEES